MRGNEPSTGLLTGHVRANLWANLWANVWANARTMGWAASAGAPEPLNL